MGLLSYNSEKIVHTKEFFNKYQQVSSINNSWLGAAKFGLNQKINKFSRFSIYIYYRIYVHTFAKMDQISHDPNKTFMNIKRAITEAIVRMLIGMYEYKKT